ncbi:MAG: EthD family reductase [Desulfobacterales bacterium]
MIRVSILYPQKEGARFDHDYYARKHIPFVRATLGPFGLVRAEVDKGIAGGPGELSLLVAAAHLIFDSLDQFQEAFASVGDQLMADVPNYTDIVPRVQFSEMVD